MEHRNRNQVWGGEHLSKSAVSAGIPSVCCDTTTRSDSNDLRWIWYGVRSEKAKLEQMWQHTAFKDLFEVAQENSYNLEKEK